MSAGSEHWKVRFLVLFGQRHAPIEIHEAIYQCLVAPATAHASCQVGGIEGGK